MVLTCLAVATGVQAICIAAAVTPIHGVGTPALLNVAALQVPFKPISIGYS